MYHSILSRIFSIPNLSLKCLTLFFCFNLSFTILIAQAPVSDSLTTAKSKARRTTRNIAIASGVVYGISLYGLNQTWYQEFPRSEFHFFNDNSEWKQLDKVGHFYSAFHISQGSIHLFQHAGMKKKKAHLWGGLMGFLILTPIEVLDGFSDEYGASWGDLAANALGSGVAMTQYMLWDEARLKPKFSFTPTSYADQRPNVLGNGLHEEFIKDYNGQTYWLSADIYAFLKPESRFPKWLNLTFGYGAENMIFANSAQNEKVGLDSYRQYYFGIDFDLSYLKGDNKLVNTLLYMVDLVHLPAPTLEFNRVDGVKFHFLKF